MDTLPVPLSPTPRRRTARPPSAPDARLRERGLALTVLALCGLAVALPAHDGTLLHAAGFADARAAWGIPCAMDVLSNLGFLLMGLWGWLRLGQTSLAWRDAETFARPEARAARRAWRACAAVFFTGLIVTAMGSAYYHWQPDAERLLVDRAAMAVAFAGLMGLAAAERVSPRAGLALLAAMAMGAAAALAVGASRGNLVPWGVVQFGGLLLLGGLAWLRAPQGQPMTRLGAVIGFYALAKLFEAGDALVFGWTQELVSGHSLKHVLASLAALPVLAALRHNESGTFTQEGRA